MLINKLFTTSVKTKMKLNLMWPWTLLLKILWHYIKTIFTLLSHEKFIFHLTQSSEKADARHDLFWLKSKIRLSIYLNKKPTCAQIWQLLFFFFFREKLYLYDTIAQTRDLLSKYKTLSSLLINLWKPKTHHSSGLVSNILILDKLAIFLYLKFELGKIWNKLNRRAKNR